MSEGLDSGFVPEPQPHKVEKVDTSQLVDTFVESIEHASMRDLISFEFPQIMTLVDRLAASTPDAKTYVDAISGQKGKRLWDQMHALMTLVEDKTGEPWVLSPKDFSEQLKPFADSQTRLFQTLDGRKTEQGYEIAEQDYEALKTKADAILVEKAFLNEQMEKHIVSSDHAAIVRDYLSGSGDARTLNGMMRSEQTCVEQTEALLEKLHTDMPQLRFARALGNTSELSGHQNIVIFPDDETRASFVHAQGKAQYPLFSKDGAADPTVPRIAEVAIIDPSIMQVFDANVFLKDIPFDERVAFVRELAPKNFSESGVFVGNFLEYVNLLGRLGHQNPRFNLT